MNNTHFDKLLGDLETLTKAVPIQDDDAEEKIQAAAGDGGDETPGDEAGMDDDDKDNKDGKVKGKKKGGKMFGKSMTVTLEDGTEVEAEDGTELVKSLTESLGALTERIDGSDTVLAKALGELVTLAKAQNTAIASMQTQIKAMAGEGRGRKAVVSMADNKPAGAAKAGEGIDPVALMAKAQGMAESGKLAWSDVALVESSFNHRDFTLASRPGLLAKITSAA